MQTDPSSPSFWQAKYAEGRTGWDLGEAAPAWERLVSLHGLAPGRTLVVGAGRGHDAFWFAERGHDVLALDFAPSAVAAIRARAAERGLNLTAREGDLFRLDPAEVGAFDLVVEHTCFCAIEPARRSEYVEAIARVLRPGGWFLGVFFWKLPDGGPPFRTSEEELRELFAPGFDLLRLEPNPASHPTRAGQEGWAVFRRK